MNTTYPFPTAAMRFLWLLLPVILLLPANLLSQTKNDPASIQKEINTLHQKLFTMPLDPLPDRQANYVLLHSSTSGMASKGGQKPYKTSQISRNRDTIPGKLIFNYSIPADTALKNDNKTPNAFIRSIATQNNIRFHTVKSPQDELYRIIKKRHNRRLLEVPHESIFLSFGNEYMLVVSITHDIGNLHAYEGVGYFYYRKL